MIYFRENREKQEKFLAALKNIGNNSGIPKMKSFAYGPFGFNKKFNYEKGLANIENKTGKLKINNKLLHTNKKFSLKKMRSSIVVNNPNLNISSNQSQKIYSSKSNVVAKRQPNQKRNSFDDKILNVSKNRKKIHRMKKEAIEEIVTRKNSDASVSKKQLIKLREKFNK